MPAKHRSNPKTQDMIYRVYRVPEPLRRAMRQKRAQRNQTVQEFIQTAVVDELPRLVESLGKLHVGPADRDSRPAKLPLDERLLVSLRQANVETGLSQSQLLLARWWQVGRRLLWRKLGRGGCSGFDLAAEQVHVFVVSASGRARQFYDDLTFDELLQGFFHGSVVFEGM